MSSRTYYASALSRKTSKRSLAAPVEGGFIKRIEGMTRCTAGNEARAVREVARLPHQTNPHLPRLSRRPLFPFFPPSLPPPSLVRTIPPSDRPFPSLHRRPTSLPKSNSRPPSNSSWRTSINRSSTFSKENKVIAGVFAKVGRIVVLSGDSC